MVRGKETHTNKRRRRTAWRSRSICTKAGTRSSVLSICMHEARAGPGGECACAAKLFCFAGKREADVSTLGRASFPANFVLNRPAGKSAWLHRLTGSLPGRWVRRRGPCWDWQSAGFSSNQIRYPSGERGRCRRSRCRGACGVSYNSVMPVGPLISTSPSDNLILSAPAYKNHSAFAI